MATEPLFSIEKLDSLAYDNFSKQGAPNKLHLVARNIAFVVHLTSSFDLAKNPPNAILVYDGPNYEEDKEVEALKTSALEITSHVDDTGLKAAVEVKVGVLSSQHEGSHFRLKFCVKEPNGVALFDYTEPIKVISKRNQVKKILERKEKQSFDSIPSPTSPKESQSTSLKRPSTEMTDTLQRLEQQQQAQLDLIQRLLSRKTSYGMENEFDLAFHQFLSAYKKIPVEERPSKVRKVISSANVPHELSEFVSLCSQAAAQSIVNDNEEEESTIRIKRGIDVDPNFLNNFVLLEPNDDACVHKKALDKLEDDLYKDFLSE